jgi:diphosphomevalonate decarboxylase
MNSTNYTHWTAPANIALVKYWGKHGDQLPQNPSISLTLSESVTKTSIAWTKSAGTPAHTFLFEGRENPMFEQRVMKYLQSISHLLPHLDGYSLQISSSNTFPHSSGISSSASFMSSLALGLIKAAEEIEGVSLSGEEFYHKASVLSRLGSGSAARSVYGGYTIWGASPAVVGSSDEFAITINHLVHPVFNTYRDAVLVISSRKKPLSSSAGHKLMESNPFAPARFESARRNASRLVKIMENGEQDDFIQLVEEEAMTLHGLIQASSGGPILMEPRTVSAISLIRDYRNQSGSKLCFTLDAGPNVHILYPDSEKDGIRNFIENALKPLCENGLWIDDHLGKGPWMGSNGDLSGSDFKN